MTTLIILSMLEAFGEDALSVGRMVARLIANEPSIDWIGELSSVAEEYQPFIDSGLSVEWWLSEVERQAV